MSDSIFTNIYRLICKTRVNLKFFKKIDKYSELLATIQVKNLEIFYISNDKIDLIIEFVSRNLVIQVNFVKFRDSQNSNFLRQWLSDDT